ncbi:MAG: M1 family metallopeptidase [Saprospiraceae bacterium]|nr:M1 family metallopeptidase [Saprospiraceae bacterium]
MQTLFARVWFFTILSIIIFSCQTKKNITYVPDELTDYREEILDTLVVSDYAQIQEQAGSEYRPSATMRYDILHTKLDLKFDWDKQHVLGKAEIDLKPYFFTLDTVSLDAKGFDIHTIKLLPSGKTLQYIYDSTKLHVILDKSYSRKENLKLYIDYTARPNDSPGGGSEAINSDKGLFFINPLGTEPDKPKQIWTQGETENNSRWFPTFDKPNERCTQEIYLTVDDNYTTLSNGKKISSTKNPDGTRTDYWKQDKPHAPYLFMIAVGEFEEVNDTWNKTPLHYYVEKGFGKHAKKIFNHTPEMLTFFSDVLQYPYPWDKYAQIVVRDFVSGAMENTTASVFGEFVQKTDRELIDDDNDYIVAHELFHHWFGNLVTCEDWSNLTLNEGFANYAEYLWFEHKYGRDRAEFHRMNEMNGYFGQVFNQGARPLIHYFYEDKENMFDAHSYNKGGMVLHMLRDYVGDDAFFASLNKYLKEHAYTAVEVDELRMAFEDTVGEDLHWFFDQWFLKSGHPVMNVKYTYNDENKVLLIEVDQLQNGEEQHENFILPVEVAVYHIDGKITKHKRKITERNARLLIEDLPSAPSVVVMDGKNVLLGLINESKTLAEYEEQFRRSPNFMDKVIAYTNLENPSDELIIRALNDPFHYIRSLGITSVNEQNAMRFGLLLQNMVLEDKHSKVRADALMQLMNSEDFEGEQLCSIILESEQAYPVIDIALTGMQAFNPDKAVKYAEKFLNEDSDYLLGTLLDILAGSGSEKYLDYFAGKARTVGIYQLFDFYTKYQEILNGKSEELLKKSADVMNQIALSGSENMFRKFMATVTIYKMKEDLSQRPDAARFEPTVTLFSNYIQNIKATEKNQTLLDRYEVLK